MSAPTVPELARLEHRPSTWRVALALTRRNLVSIRRLPATFVPVLVMPVLFLLAFSGQFNGIVGLPGFGTRNVFSWYVPMSVMMGSAFAGVGTAQSVATELESGFIDRLLLSPAPRIAMALGGIGAGLVRSTIAFSLAGTVGALAGVEVPGGLRGLVVLWFAGMGVSAASTLWGLGLVYRIKSQNAGPLMQMGMFVTLFFSTAQVPLRVMTGWLHGVARVNPMSNVIGMARSGFIDTAPWDLIWPGLLSLGAFWAVLSLFAATGLRRLVP